MATFFVLFLILPIHFIGCSKFDPTTHRGWPLINDKRCGIRTQLKTGGGKYASIGEFPWLVEFIFTLKKGNVTGFCTATIISDQFVLLPAYCRYKEPHPSKIIVGNVDRNKDVDCDTKSNICEPPMKQYGVEKFFRSNDAYSTDVSSIGLVKIQGKFEFNDFVAPICLEYGELLSKDYTGTEAEFAGWNNINDPDVKPDPSSSVLQKMTLPIQNESVCIDSINYILGPHPNQQIDIKSYVCAGGMQGQHISPWDTGGVLAVSQSVAGDIPRFFGVGVRAMSSGVDFIADVFTRISYHLEWIMDTIANESV
uniref:Seminal fluid protein n=1 Tax=Nilaparvata lugens TaxID=108931 RepID=A0A1I9WL78_NILLU|nr:seminal fluid protein [Nilaparvata lugens]